MYITWQTVITVAAVLAAIIAIAGYYNKAFKWIQRQNAQDLKISKITKEQQLLTYGILCCLRGLKEQGCNSSVTEAITKFEKHMNEQAHIV